MRVRRGRFGSGSRPVRQAQTAAAVRASTITPSRPQSAKAMPESFELARGVEDCAGPERAAPGCAPGAALCDEGTISGSGPMRTPSPLASAGSCSTQPGLITSGRSTRSPSGSRRPLFKLKISGARFPVPRKRTAISKRNSGWPLNCVSTM